MLCCAAKARNGVMAVGLKLFGLVSRSCVAGVSALCEFLWGSFSGKASEFLGRHKFCGSIPLKPGAISVTVGVAEVVCEVRGDFR